MADPRQRGSTEVDDLHLRPAGCVRGQQHVLQGEIAVGNAQAVEPLNREAELRHERLGHGLSHWTRRWGCEAPRVEVLIGQGHHHVSALLVTEYAEQFAGVWELCTLEELDKAQVKPGLLGLSWVAQLESLGALRDPAVRHPLHREAVAPLVLHLVHHAPVPCRSLKRPHQAEAAAVPRGDGQGNP
eukprot:CAMPEP_0197936054 /NCGR_PEP_ID=MMETSP1439-20131203/114315_1 /TAXON_ID=66791 /ORGANISM="Gonyaulax spinifera, Strain CCMP409" /LENGTH=185 /DNA_ID=CAMNT_0043559011 /DNA_START=501 /DNA_END=1054 /DNA_ORIENTATION=+